MTCETCIHWQPKWWDPKWKDWFGYGCMRMEDGSILNKGRCDAEIGCYTFQDNKSCKKYVEKKESDDYMF